MTRTHRYVAALVMVTAGCLGASGSAWADDDDDYRDDTGRYYDFHHQRYFDDDRTGSYQGNEGCHHDDYLTGGHNGVNSDNGCDTTRYENKGHNGNSAPDSEYGHGRRDGDEPLGHQLFDNL